MYKAFFKVNILLFSVLVFSCNANDLKAIKTDEVSINAIDKLDVGTNLTQQYVIGSAIPINEGKPRQTPALYETFAGGGWNAGNNSFSEHRPGLNESLPPNFKFHQMQGPHSFKAETNIVRVGKYSAKLHWMHDDPGQWNFSPKKIDNPDRKAMFHGPNASNHLATVWYGFSAYFPAGSTMLNEGQEALFFQIHGARDGKNEPNRVPPVALNISSKGFTYSHSWDASKYSKSTGGEGQLKYDLPAKLSDYQDRWVDFVLQVRTDPYKEDGFLKIWMDGKLMVDRTNIKVGYNDDKGFYPSFGWYLWGSNAFREHDMIMYLDEIRQVEGPDANYYDVAPGFFLNR